MKKIKVIFTICAIFLILTACSAAEDYHTPHNYVITEDTLNDPIILVDDLLPHIPTAIVVRVRIVSGGNEHSALSHWHHGFNSEVSASGFHKSPEDVADKLCPFSLEDDFQIIIEGSLFGGPSYYFYKLTDGEWIRVLAVYYRDGVERIFIIHGGSRYERGGWEEVAVEPFLDLLEPGEYILDIDAWWGDSRGAGRYQNFFRFIK